jgi:hypothetical protein
MSYEVCGDPLTGHKCAAYYRTSRDGWNYGRADSLGKRIETANGDYFEHAPANIWSPSPLSTNGVLVVVGQVLHKADGSVSPLNGKVLFVNPLLDGSGPWTTVDAPVEVQTPMTTSAQTIPRPCCQTRMERHCWNLLRITTH